MEEEKEQEEEEGEEEDAEVHPSELSLISDAYGNKKISFSTSNHNISISD